MFLLADSFLFLPRLNGGCSSVWLERQIVALKVVGSKPINLPAKNPADMPCRIFIVCMFVKSINFPFL